MAREKGLQPLADLILSQPQMEQSAAEIAAPFVNDEIQSVEEALEGAQDIVAETISDHAGIRQMIRKKALEWGTLCV